MSSSAKLFGNVFGAVYLPIGLVGFALISTDANILALNLADNSARDDRRGSVYRRPTIAP
ncbi:MAG: hypothetical protein M3O70_13135 [Actinomycetota bacterium]|nr:hypothetical protein [Actinomycetota bacterium]